jgi:hypothetical protein
MSERLPGYDSWKTAGPPEASACPDCGGRLDPDGQCAECCDGAELHSYVVTQLDEHGEPRAISHCMARSAQEALESVWWLDPNNTEVERVS